MIKPDFATPDDALEFAAQLVEERSLLDLRGLMSRRKRDREDAQVRLSARDELRRELADLIRAFKDRPDLSPLTALKRIAEADDRSHELHLRDAWQLAAKGWVRVLVNVDCTGNSIPPEARYRVEVTERGRRVLEGAPE